MESFLSFASSHPYIVVCVFCCGFFFLYALIGSIARSIADVKITKEKCKRVDSAINNGYEYVELGDMVLQKHDENVKEKVVLPKQEESNAKIVNIIDYMKQLGGGAGQ